MTIVQDAAIRPDVFWFAGSIPSVALAEWCQRHRLTIPEDLFELWAATGGGEIFETESILQPMAVSGGDGVLEVNGHFWNEKGLSRSYLIFHMGLFTTALDLDKQIYVRLHSETLRELQKYGSLEEWYSALRAAYADKYELPSAE